MIEWLKKYGMIVGLLVAALGGTGTLVAYAGSAVDLMNNHIKEQVTSELDRVQFAMSMKVQKDLEGVARKLNGVQEQVNGSVADNREIKERLKSLDRQQSDSNKSMERRLDLIIKLIEAK